MLELPRRSLALVLVVGAAAPALATDSPSLGRALADGEFGVDLRYRWEQVDDDGFDEAASASTLRTAVWYRSARFHSFGIGFEVENVTDLGAADLHDNGGAGSLWNGVTDRPRINDPEITEFQQVHLEYHGLPDTAIRAGRQDINLGDERFIGTSGWRQNHQSFDALRVDQGSLPRAKLVYVYLANANTSAGGDRDQDSHLLHAAIETGRHGVLTPYVYHLDFDDETAAAPSTRTVGASWEGKAQAAAWKLPYRVEWAEQVDVGDNPENVDAGYLRLHLDARRRGLVLTGGYEVLEGSPEDGRFTTPLATLHRHNGWADKFTDTPVNGLEDLYLAVGFAGDTVAASLVYHDFDAESAGPDHGSEVDGLVSYEAGWGQSFALKLAWFDAATDSAFVDTAKLWAYTSYSF